MSRWCGGSVRWHDEERSEGTEEAAAWHRDIEPCNAAGNRRVGGHDPRWLKARGVGDGNSSSMSWRHWAVSTYFELAANWSSA